jgi:hypothetical protein
MSDAMTASTTAPERSFLATGRGPVTLALLCAVTFLDVMDGSIVNVALPTIRTHLGFSVQNLQWAVSGYLITYGGFLLLGGRAGDLLGRRRLLIAGTALFAASSLACGLAGSQGLLIGGRLAQGFGAAMMSPAALSILTTTFQDSDRHKALGVWAGISGLASAVGLFSGGLSASAVLMAACSAGSRPAAPATCWPPTSRRRRHSPRDSSGPCSSAPSASWPPEPSRCAPPAPAASRPPRQKPSQAWNPPTTPRSTAQRNPGMAFNAIPGFSDERARPHRARPDRVGGGG